MRALVLVMLAACWSGGEPPPQTPAQHRTPAPVVRAQPATTDEHTDDVDDSNTTVLHTRKWKFAGYFQRLKAQIAAHWSPPDTWNHMTPQMRSVYGTATRTLVVEISLDDAGDVHNLAIVTPSGVPDFDTDSVLAIMNAAPFEAPPLDLRPLTFKFSFVFDPDQQSASARVVP